MLANAHASGTGVPQQTVKIRKLSQKSASERQ